MSNSVWTWIVPGEAATLVCGSLRATAILCEKGGFFCIDQWRNQKTSFPIHDKQFGDADIAALHALNFFPPRFRSESLELADANLRGSDMVASFAESGGQRVAPEIYWRASHIEDYDATKIELIVSVRTGLLDSQPASVVHSRTKIEAELLHALSLDATRFSAVEQAPTKVFVATQSTEQLFLIRLAQYNLSYAQMVHPSDFVSSEAQVDIDSFVSLETKLFPDHLEKGVIRRARICGWFMPAENDLETAVALAREFVDEPLPLTA